MVFRKLWLIIAVVIGAMASPLSFGIGLGEITLNSNLNQPLNADVRLIQVGDLEPEEILVRLGSVDDFRRRGIERIFFLQDLRFEVQLNAPNGPIVKVTSQKPVVEPFLIFILEMETQRSGRAQREYTLLLDLPVFNQRPAQPVQGARTQPPPQPRTQPQPTPPAVAAQPTSPPPAQPRPQPSTANTSPPPPLPTRPDTPPPTRPQPQPVVRTPAQPSTPPEPLSPSLQSGETYSVRANDTLWEIALNTRPNRGVSVQQTMLALQRLNPDAFINNNINLLKEGQVLRIPDINEIQQLNQREAVNEVAYQNTQRYGNPDGIVGGAELQASRNVPRNNDADNTPRGQLTLASPSDPARVTGDRSGAGISSSERDALENELAITLEQLDSSERESAELNERVQELEEQISTMERLIDVTNEEMRSLQLALEQSARAGDNTLNLDLPADDSTPSDDSLVENTSQTDTPPTTDVPAASPTAQPAPVQPPVVPVAPQTSIVDTLMDYLWYIVGGVAIILLGAFYMWYRKTQSDMASFDEFDDDVFDDQEQMDFGGDDFQEQPFDEGEEDFDLAMDDEPIADDEPAGESTVPTEAQTGDAVGEADIYIAYGKYDQAEEMLQRAIIAEPDNVEARLKLLEVYSETSDVNKFDGEYGKLLALGDATASARAAELRTAIPGAPQYQTPADTTVDRQFDTIPEQVAVAADDDLDLDLGDDDLTGEFEQVEVPAAAAEPEEDNSFDFDLDTDSDDGFGELDLDLGDNDTSAKAAAEPEEDDGGIDFNLDLDGETELALDSEEDQELSLDLDDDETEIDAIDANLTIRMEDTDEEGMALDTEEDDDLSFDLDADEAEFDKEFESVLDDGGLEPEPDASVNETVSRDFETERRPQTTDDEDDDILSDLEFSAAALATEEDNAESLTQDADAHGIDAELSADDVDDDFDLDMGDVDLAALDEEMDALVGDLDDVDDDDVAVSPTEVVPALSEDDLDDAGIDFDIEPKSSAPAASQTASYEEPEGDLDEDSELDFLADTDEVATKLDLARAYIDMGDKDGAKDILSEVATEGNDEQKQEAQELLGKID